MVWEQAVTYFCFIESNVQSVPHMEPLSAETADEAAREAERLMAQHANAVAAHVFLGEQRLMSLQPSKVRETPSRP